MNAADRKGNIKKRYRYRREWMGEDKDMREMLNIQNKKANGFDKSLGLWGRMLIDWRRIFDFITEDCWVSCKEPSYKQVSVHVCIISRKVLRSDHYKESA